MKLIEHRWVHVIWCDDVRQEVGNKPSFMGIYTGAVVMPSVPSTLPRLTAFINVGTPKQKPFERLKVRVVRNDSEGSVAEIEMLPEDLKTMTQQIAASQMIKDAEDAVEPAGIALAFILMLSPINITDNTKWLKVFVDTEDETLESFKLRFTTAQQENSAVQAAS